MSGSGETTSFFESALCRSRRHCRGCRLSASYRQGIAARFAVPERDFACPHGVTVETLPAVTSIPEQAANTRTAMRATPPVSDFPPVHVQAGKLARAIGAFAGRSLAKGRPATVSEDERERRMSICRGCADYAARRQRCRRCGCVVRFKTLLETEHCPIGNW